MIVKVFDKIDLDKSVFRKVDLKTFNDFYLIGIDSDSLDIDSITFEVAIDSGVKNKPLILPNIKLDFKDFVSGVRILNHPSEFYIRPIQVIDKEKFEVHKSGNFDIEININALNLD